MNYITEFAESFMKLFQLGGETFISWMTNIVPLVLMLLIAMNTLIAFLGEEKVNSLAKISAKNPVSRYMILPFISAFMLGNPMAISMGRFLPEYYKPSFVAAQMQFCHTSNGVFPHINPGGIICMDGNCDRNSNFRFKSNGLSHSLHACWACHELCRWLGNRFYNCLCSKTARCYLE